MRSQTAPYRVYRFYNRGLRLRCPDFGFDIDLAWQDEATGALLGEKWRVKWLTLKAGCHEFGDPAALNRALVWKACVRHAHTSHRTPTALYRDLTRVLCAIHDDFGGGLSGWWDSHAHALRWPPYLRAMKRRAKKRATDRRAA